ncbi:hypothetical protein RN001_000931 [Aquatica leii]|uniref:Origin recognition complex subunit 4 n=1 Tax=Aquatica leii TaxID=1421715 RepID=A0AAN7QA13_9COLE|nr:hypothetical protein RN001_000931 [Aquatica leii]
MVILNKNILKTRSQIKHNIMRVDKLVGFEKQHKQILDLFKETVNIGESNSALLIGPRGVGKTILLKSVFTELKNKTFDKVALLVHLHGLVHVDDRLALKSITAQMKLDNAVDGKVFGSFADNLAFLLACLKTGNKETAKSVIFILEEFDLFCSHHNQTLLYNLFDVSQSAQTPICVFGVTCRLDIIELFEKRVKSRFSHRQIFLFSENNQIENRLQRIKDLLCLKHNEELSKNYVDEWNKAIQQLLKDKKFRNLMQRMLHVDSSDQTLKNMLILVISQLNDEKLKITTKDFDDQWSCFERDDLTCVLQDLSVLEICLLIAMKHHLQIYDDQTFNFEIVLTRYNKFVKSHSNIQEFHRAGVLKAFEHLQNLELIASATGVSSRQKEYEPFKLSITPEQIMDGITKTNHLPTEVVQWASTDLI